MLCEVPIDQWLMLILSLFLYLGPGLWLYGLLRPQKENQIIFVFLNSFVLSITFWAVLLVYFRFLQVAVLSRSFVYTVSIISWLGGLFWIIRLKKQQRLKFVYPDTWKIILIVALGCSVLINTYALRHMVVGLGSDSNHHTLITQLIIWNRGLPNNYSPAYPEIITFNYHFGFHALAAILSLLSDWEPRLIVLILAPLLISFSGLAAANFAWRVFRSTISMSITGTIPSLVAVFPAAMLEWGRYPQTLGLIILSVFLSEYISLKENTTSKKNLLFLSLLAGGLSLTHYRVTIMGIVAVLLWEIFNLRIGFHFIKNRWFYIIGIPLIGLIFVWPWFLQVYLNQFVGYPVQYSTPGDSFFSIGRLGKTAIEYPSNELLISAFLLCGLWAIIKRDQVGYWIFSWLIGLLLVSQLMKGLQYTYVDPVTIISSSYLPVSLMIGWGINHLEKTVPAKRITPLFQGVFLVCFLGGAYHMNGLLDVPAAAYVKPEDLKAAEWIKTNTPEDSCFVVNTYRFEFSTNFIIGSDAGGWLPVLAQRCVVVYPMTSNIERFNHPNALDKVVMIHNLECRIASPNAIEVLRKFGIKYVYVGQGRTSKCLIDSTALLRSGLFEKVYSRDYIEIFKIK